MYPKRDYSGERPCIPPHILGRLLDRLPIITLKLRTRKFDWTQIDDLAKTLQSK
jgi:hypothetical protein